MLSSIHPFGERSRNSRWSITVAAYIAASTVGGAVSGLLAGLTGEVVASFTSPQVRLAVLGTLALVALAVDRGVGGLRNPGLSRQVNEVWLSTYRGWVYGAGFGFQLGLGWATIIVTSTTWLAGAAVVALSSWKLGVAVGGLFGLCRGAVILITAPITTPAALRSLHRRIEAGAPTIRRAAEAALLATAVTAAVGALA